MSRFSAGLHLTDDSVRIAIVNVRSGEVTIHDGSIRALTRAWSDAVADRRIIGVGIAYREFPGTEMLNALNLPAVPVVSVLERYACVPGCGVASPSTLVMLMDESRFLMNSRIVAAVAEVEGPNENAILPGYFAYEFERPSIMPLLKSIARTFHSSEDQLQRDAARLPAGAIEGLSAGSSPAQIYRATIEAAAFDLHHVCESMRAASVPVRRFVACGPVALQSLVMQSHADILDGRIKLAESEFPAALGAAILGCIAAGPVASGHASVSQAIHAMARQRRDLVYRPDLKSRRAYAAIRERLGSIVTAGGVVRHVFHVLGARAGE